MDKDTYLEPRGSQPKEKEYLHESSTLTLWGKTNKI